jgi:hypothetical protein
MAKKKSPGCGIVIIGLIALSMVAKYWYLFVAVGIVALVIWLITKYFQTDNINAAMNSTKTSSELHLRVICDACEDFPSTLIEDINNPILESDSGSLQYRTSLQVTPSASSISTSQQNGGDAEDEEQNINRLGAAASVHAEIMRILDTENSAMRERVDLVNAEIEFILATEKDAVADVSAVKKAATEVAAKIKASEEKELVIKRLLAVLVFVKTQHIPDSEKAVMRERVLQVNAVVKKDPTEVKAAAEVAMNIINRLKTALVDTEIQRILDVKKAALQERVAQVNTEIEQNLAT